MIRVRKLDIRKTACEHQHRRFFYYHFCNCFIKEVDKVTGFIVLVAYTLLMLGVSYLLTRRQTTLQGFLVGDRRMGTIKSAMSIAATWIWAPALFVSAEKAYSNG